MTRNALIVWGGWEGHSPRQIAQLFESALTRLGFQVEVSDSLDAFLDYEKLAALSLVVPVWTMGEITSEQLEPLLAAVRNGTGLAGCHGGMCDAFRAQTEYHFMSGGQWVSHPGNDGVTYGVTITDRQHFITQGLDDFEVTSEQYYMHVDPAVKVLARTRFPVAEGPHTANGPVDMPVAWTKCYGKGRVFYCSLGHTPQVIEVPPVLEMCTRGLLWAANAEDQ